VGRSASDIAIYKLLYKAWGYYSACLKIADNKHTANNIYQATGIYRLAQQPKILAGIVPASVTAIFYTIDKTLTVASCQG
jgi:hypothetical protein